MVSKLVNALRVSDRKPEWFHIITCLDAKPMTTSELLDCVKGRGSASGRYAMMDLNLLVSLGIVRYSYDSYAWILTDRGKRLINELMELLARESDSR